MCGASLCNLGRIAVFFDLSAIEMESAATMGKMPLAT